MSSAAMTIRPAVNDEELKDVLAVAAVVSRGPLSLEDLQHFRSTMSHALHVVAFVDGEPAGFGYGGIWPGTEEDSVLQADLAVLPENRGMGVGSALIGRISEHGRDLGKNDLLFEVMEDDPDSLTFLARRGYAEVERQMQVALDLNRFDQPGHAVPEGVAIVTRAERPDLLEQMYQVGAEAQADVPGMEGEQQWTFDEWKAWEIDRPTNRPDLCFFAVAGDRVVGYALLQAFDQAVYHGFTAVSRDWRNRGVGKALTLRQIAAAKAMGYERLFCESEERNVPMRRLTESLGYQPTPASIVLRGPLKLP